MYVPNPPEQSESFTSVGSISPPLTPLKIGLRSPIMASEAGSDTQSIRSSRSISSLGAAVVKHPELTQRGLSASIIECVNAAFESAIPTKVQVTGEIALAYHGDDNHENTAEHAIIRIDNFAVLEKVAPNPAFLSAVPGNPGEYNVSLLNIRKTSVALKYQVHVDESNREMFPPIVVQTVWKIEPHQSSVILTWKPNPGFKHQRDVDGPLTLHNVAFIVGIEGTHALSCQSKPVGTFSREKGRIVWKLNDLHFDPRTPDDGGKMLARFATDGQAKALPAEVRWEMVEFDGMGSGLGISMDSKTATAGEEETDPFADETEKDGADGNEGVPEKTWTAVQTARRLMGGKYTAS